MTVNTSQNTRTLKVAIQGFPGSFHDMAARKFFPDYLLEILACETFRDCFELVKDDKAALAIVAIENSLAGSLLPNYTLLRSSGLRVWGEIYLRIEQNLMALPGQGIAEIREVQSHPMAIIQSEEFLDPLRRRGVKIVDTIDTALSARNISRQKLKGVAALASSLAAKMYGLAIIAPGVETNKRNFTRFLVLAKNDLQLNEFSQQLKPNKASICFALPHKIGSLSQILSVLAFYQINLTKIQSAPIIGREWEYFFYVDLNFSNYEMYQRSLEAIIPLTDQLQILGEYQTGKY